VDDRFDPAGDSTVYNSAVSTHNAPLHPRLPQQEQDHHRGSAGTCLQFTTSVVFYANSHNTKKKFAVTLNTMKIGKYRTHTIFFCPLKTFVL